MHFKRLALLLLVAALAGSLCTGCWNRREPELLGIVLAAGFDYNPEDGLYRVIAEIANPASMGQSNNGGDGGGGSGEKSFWTAEAAGHTPFEAVRNLDSISSRQLFWAHCRVVLFSERLARRGLKDVLDLLERGRQFRLIAKPVVVDGDLRKVMDTDFPLEETGAKGLDRFIVTNRFEKSVFPEKDLNELISTLGQQGQEMIIGKLSVPEKEKEDSKNSLKTGAPPPARVGGSALFRGDRMVGWATDNETLGWAYATGRAFRSILIIESPEKKGSYISIGAFGHNAQMRLQGDADDWRIELKVKIDGRIQDYEGPGKLDSDNELLRALERRSAAAARNRIEALLSRSQELKSDVIGFGNLIYRKNPKLWQQIESRWDEEIYPQLKIDLFVEFNILRSGLTSSPL
ncbi:MAG: Ger(x)C family spore germination protein [Firmicutes bacterium]|nr:Ger(x)C family spore germination protein [Bacillota bacterium]